MAEKKNNELLANMEEVEEVIENEDEEIIRKELIFKKRDRELQQRYLKG